MGSNLPKKLFLFSLLLIALSYVLTTHHVSAADFIFGTDPTTGEFIIKEKGGNTKLRIDSTGSLVAPLKYAPGAENLLQNGGFEVDVQNLGTTSPRPINWTLNFHTQGSSDGNITRYFTSTTSMREGSQSLELQTTSSSNGVSVASDAFNVVPGKIYTVTVDARDTTNCASGFYLRMYYYSPNEALSNPGPQATMSPSGYKYFNIITDSSTTTSWNTYPTTAIDVQVPVTNECANNTAPCTRARLAIYNWGVACTRYFDNAKVITKGTGGVINAGNVSAGEFGSNTGGGNFSIDSPTFFVNATSNFVGIGTANPTAILDIAGTTSTISNNSGPITITPNTNLIISSGNVGIGTTVPASKLDVIGAIKGSNGLTISAGTVDFPDNSIASADVNFNYAGSSSKGGAATTATALAADGANCSSGNAPLGIDASGAVQSCFDVATQTELDTHTAATSAHSATSANTASRIVMRDASGNFSAGTITAALSGNASTATALAADGSNCTAGNYPLGVNASGAVESCTPDDDAPDSDAEVPDAITVNNGLLYAPTSGNVGIGTAVPEQKLDVAGNITAGANYIRMGNGYAVGTRQGTGNYRIETTGTLSASCATGTNVNLTTNWAVAFSSTPHCLSTAWNSNTDPAATNLKITTCSTTTFTTQVRQSTGSTLTCYVSGLGFGPTTMTSAFDLAESYKTKDQSIESGDVVCVDPSNNNHIVKCTNPYDKAVIGIVSTEPGLVIGDDLDPASRLVGLVGRAPVKVTLENGPIERGDLLTPSATRPGFAMKATRAGEIIGKALQPFNGKSTVLGKHAFDGLSEERIKEIIKKTEETGEGQTMAFINISWYDPDVYLTDSGDLHISRDLSNLSSSSYLLKKDNQPIFRIGAFAEVVSAKVRAGIIDTKELIVDNINILKKLDEVSTKVEEQQKEINNLKEKIYQLEKN